jgi:hypothetical protein
MGVGGRMLARRLGFGMVILCRAAFALCAAAKTMVIVNGGFLPYLTSSFVFIKYYGKYRRRDFSELSA